MGLSGALFEYDQLPPLASAVIQPKLILCWGQKLVPYTSVASPNLGTTDTFPEARTPPPRVGSL